MPSLNEKLRNLYNSHEQSENFKLNLLFQLRAHDFLKSLDNKDEKSIIIEVEKLTGLYVDDPYPFQETQRFLAMMLCITLKFLNESKHPYFGGNTYFFFIEPNNCQPYINQYHQSLKTIVDMDAEKERVEKLKETAWLGCYTFLKGVKNKDSPLYLKQLPIDVIKIIFKYVYPFKKSETDFANSACTFFNNKQFQLLKRQKERQVKVSKNCKCM